MACKGVYSFAELRAIFELMTDRDFSYVRIKSGQWGVFNRERNGRMIYILEALVE